MVIINTAEVYKQLKKQNGEAVARVIRDAVLLDVPTIVHVLEYAGRNPEEVRELIPIIREIYKQTKQSDYHTDKDPLQLLSEAGYDAFVVKTEEQKNSIKKYYRPGEMICTLQDPCRHKEYYMIHAIKRGADKIKPSDNPQREDEYGTSVISIQIAKTGGFISIKNRYNHTVNDPDNTFNSNPDNIIPGLSESLKKFFDVDFNVTDALIPSGFIIVNDQLVRYDYEINNKYFGSNYYVEGSTITKLNNDNQILFDYGFVLTVSKGKNTVQSITGEHLDFCNALNDFLRDKKIRITVGADKQTKTILVNDERFMDITNGKITFINAPNFETIHISRKGNLSGDLDFSGVKHLFLGDANCSGITSVKLNPNATTILDGPGLKLSGDLDFSGVKFLDLDFVDLSGVGKIKFNPNADNISINSRGIKLSGDLDFSGVKNLNLSTCDYSDVKSIKLNPNASSINLGKNLKLSGDLDFSGVKNLNLSTCDFSDVKSIKLNPNASSISLIHAKNLSGSLDFAKAHSVDLSYSDLTSVAHIKISNRDTNLDFAKIAGILEFVGVGYADFKNIQFTDGSIIKFGPQITGAYFSNLKMTGNIDFITTKHIEVAIRDSKLTNVRFGPNASEITVSGSSLIGDMDFSSLNAVGLLNCNLDQVTNIKFNPNAEWIDLRYSTGLKLSGDLDFSKVDILTLNSTDTSNVTSIKFNPKATVIGLTDMKLSGDLDFSHVKELYLMGSDLTNVKSITLSSSAAKWLRGQKVVINGKIVLGRNLSKYGIKVKRSNLFTDAKKKVEELKARKKASSKIKNNKTTER
ncbi:MAG: hypothetical protein J6Y49_01380 [Alphaproteobacteria bacterium]|nr:hypothetical protein [Alphaproteobacteria bacterium]